VTEEKKPNYRAKAADADWGAIERHYRAGLLSENEIARQYGVSRPGLKKRADKEGWVRDTSHKVDAATKEKIRLQVATDRVAGQLPVATKLDEKAVVDAYSDAAAAVDNDQRRDVHKALSIQRSMLEELEQLTKPEFAERLAWLGKVMDESGPTPSGGWKTDKINELYLYVISLGGRIKMAKELGAAHGVYLPLQRKMFGLDAGKSAAPFEDLLLKLGAAQQENQ
jgi:hypothetical protein